MRKKNCFISIVMAIVAFTAIGSLVAKDALSLVLIKKAVDAGTISPDGKTLLFIKYNDSKRQYELFSHTLATKKETRLFSGFIVSPRMDSAGTRIVFKGETKVKGVTREGLWIINADGSGLRAFPASNPSNTEDGYAFWSPDGTQIAFTRSGQIWMALADGSSPRLMAKGGPNSFSMVNDWMDNTLLLTRSDYSGDKYTRYLMDQKTGKLTKLGLRTYMDSTIFINSTKKLLYGTGPLSIWNVEDDKEDPENMPIKPGFKGDVWLSRSADSSKILLEAKDEMDTSKHHLYLLGKD